MGKRIRAPSSIKSVTAETIIAAFCGLGGFLNEVLPVMPFWWRFACLCAFVLLLLDLCLRSDWIKHYLPNPTGRVSLSLFIIVILGVVLWTPMRTQYMNEHLPPSIPFIVGAPVGENDSPVWAMFVVHYGPSPTYNCTIDFLDQDRARINERWVSSHPGSSAAPPSLTGTFRKSLAFAEVDPNPGIGIRNFPWTPVDPDHQHYWAGITCRDGQFSEEWEVSRIEGRLRTTLTLNRAEPWLKRDPDLQKGIFECRDKPFSNLFPDSLKIDPRPEIAMGWQANHYYAIPTVILGGEGSFYNLSSVNDEDSGCWDLLSKHYGDAKLPLSLPKGPMAIPIIFYGVLVLAVPLYCLLAFRWTGVSVMKNVTIKIREYVEGDDATENFEQGMKALFSVPKEDVVKAEKKKKQKRRASSRAESVRKPHPSDKD